MDTLPSMKEAAALDRVARLQAHRAVQREPGGGDVVLGAGTLPAKVMAGLRGAALLGPLELVGLRLLALKARRDLVPRV